MIAVAPDKGAQVLLVPVGEDEMEVERRLLPHPRVEDFIHDEKAHAVGQLQQFACGLVVRHADGVAAELAQHLQLPFRRAPVERRTQRAEVVMLVDALDANTFAIDEQAVRLAFDGADAETGFVNVEDSWRRLGRTPHFVIRRNGGALPRRRYG